ncbi:MAG: hypothetical protein ACE5JG_09780 [Planctomycetota bacterium]
MSAAARRLLPALLLAAGCAHSPLATDLRLTTRDGRINSARAACVLDSPAGGFISFRDLVTREQVRLPLRTYLVDFCEQAEVLDQQHAYIDDPDSVPRVRIPDETPGPTTPP